MKLILTDEVDGLGAPGDIVEVKDGYGRNYLLPQRLATAWTKGAQKQVATIKRVQGVRDERSAESAAHAKAALESGPVTIAVRAGDTGRLFGAVTAADVAAAIEAAGGPTVDRRDITLSEAIKAVGRHEVAVRLLAGTTATVVLDVTAAE